MCSKIAGARPLVAVGGLLRPPRRPRDPVAVKHLPHRRVRLADRARDEARPPTGMTPAFADPLLQLSVEQPRASPRPARAIEQPAARTQLLLACGEPPMPPAMGGGGRHAEGGGRRLLRHPIRDRLRQREPTRRSELRSRVSPHPGPPWAVSRGRPTASGEARTSFQPFTTCVGSSPSYLQANETTGWRACGLPAWNGDLCGNEYRTRVYARLPSAQPCRCEAVSRMA